MAWKHMYERQVILDARIREQHGLIENNLVTQKLLAFQVELGELANETRCFKYWTTKPAAPFETIVEEYVDGIHFLISIGIEAGYGAYIGSNIEQDVLTGEALSEKFLDVFRATNRYYKDMHPRNFMILFEAYEVLGRALGIDERMMFEAYVKKNEKNHVRQDENY
ncbi:MAG: dUTP diphosphatase [Bacilli bacterium]